MASTPSPWLERKNTETELLVRLEVQGKCAAEERAGTKALQEARKAGAGINEMHEAAEAAARAAEEDGSGWILSGLRILLNWRDDTIAEDYPATENDMCAILTDPNHQCGFCPLHCAHPDAPLRPRALGALALRLLAPTSPTVPWRLPPNG